jgi:flagellar biosynthesis protein FlhB
VTRLLSKELLVDLAFSAVKVAAVFWLVWSVLKVEFLTLGKLLFTSPGGHLSTMFRPLSEVTVKSLALMAVMAGADFALNRHRFMKKNMMTKEEAKREYKEDEGDPLIRSRRKRKHRELAKGRAQVEVPRADALLVNPTHIAIALRYRKEEGAAPRVLAKGKGALAELMREIARANGVPIVQDIPLARLLYKKVKVGKSVPAETYKAVAAVLAFVYRMTGRAPGQGATR